MKFNTEIAGETLFKLYGRSGLLGATEIFAEAIAQTSHFVFAVGYLNDYPVSLVGTPSHRHAELSWINITPKSGFATLDAARDYVRRAHDRFKAGEGGWHK